MHLAPGVPARGARTAVVLVERPLAEQHDQLDVLQPTRPAGEVVIDKPTAGQGEELAPPPELVRDRARAEQAAALTGRPEQPPAPRACGGADLEQPVAV